MVLNENNQDKYAEVLEDLIALNVKKVTITFSGGNDSGGHDAIFIEAESPDDMNRLNEIIDSNVYIHNGLVTEYDPTANDGQGGYVRRPPTDQEKYLHKIKYGILSPIFDTYHTFAGDFYVEGTLEWDCLSRQVCMDGQESETVWNSVHKTLDIPPSADIPLRHLLNAKDDGVEEDFPYMNR